jgi:hypothetical protein
MYYHPSHENIRNLRYIYFACIIGIAHPMTELTVSRIRVTDKLSTCYITIFIVYKTMYNVLINNYFIK